MNFKINLFLHLYETHITPLGIPIPTVLRVSDGVGHNGGKTSCQNPNPTTTQPNITYVGFDMKMTLHHHPPPPTHTNSMSAISQLLLT